MAAATSPDQIAARLEAVRRRIARAAEGVRRDPASVTLIVVTKGFPPSVIEAAHRAGLRRYGENRLEEAIPKMAELAGLPDVEWHLVGTIQSRKASRVGVDFALIHSVDRVKIARRLNAVAAAAGHVQPVLVECNVSGEAAKAGWPLWEPGSEAAATPELAEIAALPGLDLRGLMTMAPWGAPPEELRRVFRGLAGLGRRLADRLGRPLPELSMGMSDDFEAAVAEGATLVRIGRAILGERG